jgi:hypothetical protein
MTIPVSTAPQAVLYLYNAIADQVANDPTPTNIYLCIGDPGTPDPPDIIEVCAGIVNNWEHFTLVGSGGPKAGYEKYQITYKISSAQAGDTEADIAPVLMPRVWALHSYVDTAVRTDPSFGGLLVEGWPGQVTGGSPKWADSGTFMLCELTGRVQCEAQL